MNIKFLLSLCLITIFLLRCGHEKLAVWQNGSLFSDQTRKIYLLYANKLPSSVEEEQDVIRQYALIHIFSDFLKNQMGQVDYSDFITEYQNLYLKNKILKDLLFIKWRSDIFKNGIDVVTVRYLQSDEEFSANRLQNIRNRLLADSINFDEAFRELEKAGQAQEKTGVNLTLPLIAFPEKLQDKLLELQLARKNNSRTRYLTDILAMENKSRLFELLDFQKLKPNELLKKLSAFHDNEKSTQEAIDEFFERAVAEDRALRIGRLTQENEPIPLPSDWEQRGLVLLPDNESVSTEQIKRITELSRNRKDTDLLELTQGTRGLANSVFRYMQLERIFSREAYRMQLHKHTEFKIRLDWEIKVYSAETYIREQLLPGIEISGAEAAEAAQKIVETLFVGKYGGNLTDDPRVIQAAKKRLRSAKVRDKENQILKDLNFQFTGNRL